MVTLPTGLTVPQASDAYQPDADIRTLADSLAGKVIIPVANETERSALVAALGWTPTPARPLYVHRVDSEFGEQAEVTTDGTTWRRLVTTALPNSPTAWQQVTIYGAGCLPGDFGYKPAAMADGQGFARLRGVFKRAAGLPAGSACLNLPAIARPPVMIQVAIAGTNGKIIRAEITSAGDVILYGDVSGMTWASLDSIIYPIVG